MTVLVVRFMSVYQACVLCHVRRSVLDKLFVNLYVLLLLLLWDEPIARDTQKSVTLCVTPIVVTLALCESLKI